MFGRVSLRCNVSVAVSAFLDDIELFELFLDGVELFSSRVELSRSLKIVRDGTLDRTL